MGWFKKIIPKEARHLVTGAGHAFNKVIPYVGGALLGGAMGGGAKGLLGKFGSVLPSLIGAGGDILGGRESQQFNSAEAAKQREFEERMSNTAIERRKADLERSGFNPMLAFMGSGVSGESASTPGGASASGPDLSQVGSRATSAFQSNRLVSAQLQNIQADTELKGSTAAQAEANTALLRETKERVVHEIEKVMQEVENLKTEQDLKKFDLAKLKPLQAAYQAFVNDLTAAGIPAAEADAKFWVTVQQQGGITAKALMFLKQLLRR